MDFLCLGNMVHRKNWVVTLRRECLTGGLLAIGRAGSDIWMTLHESEGYIAVRSLHTDAYNHGSKCILVLATLILRSTTDFRYNTIALLLHRMGVFLPSHP